MTSNPSLSRAAGAALALLLLASPGGATTAEDLCPLPTDPCVLSGTVTVTAGSVLDFGARTFRLPSGAVFKWSGDLTIKADTVDFQLGSLVLETTNPVALGFLEITARTSTLAGQIVNAGAGLFLNDTAPGDGPHVISGKIKVKDDQTGVVAVDSFGDITISGKIDAKAKSVDAPSAEYRLRSTFGNILLTQTAKIKAIRETAEPFTDLYWVEAGTGTLTVDGLLQATAKAGAWAINLEANGDVSFGPFSKVIAKAKTDNAMVGINSQLGSVFLQGKVLAGTKDLDGVSDPDGVGVCAAQHITLAPKAVIDGTSKWGGGTVVLGAGGTVVVGSALGGAKLLTNEDSGDLEICGDDGVTIASASKLKPDPPTALGGSGDCLSPGSPAFFFLDCGQ